MEEFEEAVKKAVTDVKLDNDVVVSVFETNIRVLGYGLLLIGDRGVFLRYFYGMRLT